MIEVFGWVAAAIGLAAGVPQLIRILSSRSSAGVSLSLWQLNAATTAAWAVHGILTDTPQMEWPNVIGASVAVGILVFVLRDRRQRFLPQLILPVVVAVALSCTDVYLGAMVFGFVVAVPQLVGQLAQTRELVIAPDVSGVSLGFLVVFWVVQTMWWIFGIVQVDWALIVCAGFMVITTTMNVAIYAVRWTRDRARRRSVDTAPQAQAELAG
ncbi:MAG: PQ-loop domain-containing transporter [Arachnia sp.]